MRKSQEVLVGEYDHIQVFNYTYYFDSKEEAFNFQLGEDERILERYYTDGIFAIKVEDVRACKRKNICEAADYMPFIKNLQKVQYSFHHPSEWYNSWIDYVNKMSYNKALPLIELLNEFYITGKETNW